MKKIYIYFILSVLFISMFGNKNLYANGIGIYLPTTSYLGSGSISWIGYDDQNSGNINSNHLGIGIFYDNQISGTGDFNLRIALIYESVNEENKDKYHPPFRLSEKEDIINYSRYSTDIIYRFGILRSKRIRLWLGPNIRFSYMSKNHSTDLDEWRLGLGAGLIAGCNFHIMKRMSLSLEIGGRENLYSGKKEYILTDITRQPIGIEAEGIYITYAELFFNLGIIFHLSSD